MEENKIELMKVKNVKDFGVFLEWKETEDLFMPVSEHFPDIRVGDECYVIITYDEEREKYFASEKIGKHLKHTIEPDLLEVGQRVEGIVYSFSPLGANVMVKGEYSGLIYENEIFKQINVGDTISAVVKEIRSDGKINLALTKQGYRNFIGVTVGDILAMLEEAGGSMPFNDKSSPDEIKNTFQMSKTQFKQAIGKLYKEKKIVITKDGIELT